MKKYKATINVYRDKWDRYLAYCKELGSDGSREFEKFIDCFVEGKSYKYESEADWDNLPSAVKVFEDILVERVLLRLKYNTERVNQPVSEVETASLQTEDSEADTQVSTQMSKRTANEVEQINKKSEMSNQVGTEVDGQVNQPVNEIEIVSLQIEDSEVSTQTSNWTPSQTDINTNTMPKNTSEHLSLEQWDSVENQTEILVSESSFQEPLEDWAREVFTDTEVGKLEGRDKSTILRRRNKLDKSKNKEFWARWEVSTLNPKRWWRVQDMSAREEDKS